MRINKAIQIALAALSVCLIGGLSIAVVESFRVRTLTLAAGSPEGESYILATAIKKVV